MASVVVLQWSSRSLLVIYLWFFSGLPSSHQVVTKSSTSGQVVPHTATATAKEITS